MAGRNANHYTKQVVHSSYYPTEKSQEVSDLVTMLATELLPLYQSTNLDCNFEVIPYIPDLLGHQNESEQIVTTVHSQTSTLYST